MEPIVLVAQHAISDRSPLNSPQKIQRIKWNKDNYIAFLFKKKKNIFG